MKIAIHWFRRDLRFDDNVALHHAVNSQYPVLPLFIFDTNILQKLANKNDARVDFIYQQLQKLHQYLLERGSRLLVKIGDPITIWQELVSTFDIAAVYTNRDYEPYAQSRDRKIYAFLQQQSIIFKGYKDHVIFEKHEVVKKDGTPYTVFTPYSKVWKKRYAANPPISYTSNYTSAQFYNCAPEPIPSLQAIGFVPSNQHFPSAHIDEKKLVEYKTTREFPAQHGTTRISVHLRFGTISIRRMAAIGAKQSTTWLNELIWRDFYQAILYHFPHSVTQAFKPQYQNIPWINNPIHFKHWCAGTTGYPMVDAGMRELNATGFMHNRVRMVTASFLTKHLLIDWRWGERYFAQKLLDFELASNVGGWQWAASTGCDAAPYFRIFNPESQRQKFDKQYQYIKKWVPEFGTDAYPAPIVVHKTARLRAIEVFKTTLNKAKEAAKTS